MFVTFVMFKNFIKLFVLLALYILWIKGSYLILCHGSIFAT